MITIPNKRPTTLRTFEVDFGTTIASAIWSRIIQGLNWYNDALPIGMLLNFYQSQTFANGNPIPDPIGLWQFCDGSTVIEANSPLLGQTLPDLREKFLKGGSTIGTLGGQLSINLTHSHGGATGFTDDGDFSSPRLDDGDENQEHHNHAHAIGADLGSQPTVPPYVDLQYFMKIDGAATIDTALAFAQIDDNYSKYGKIVATELLQTIKAAIDYINAAVPVGEMVPIMTNIPGVVINPKIWQECDGSEITDADSPLHSLPGSPRFTPNMTDRYVKFPSIGLVGLTGGQNFRTDLGHSHGGRTGSTGYGDNNDTDSDHFGSTDHYHTIATDLNAPVNCEPPYYTVKFFMRIQ